MADGTRSALVAAGVRLVDEQGLSGVGVRAVAAAAGVSHGAPRRYFPDLASLLAAIARDGVEDLGEQLLPALERGISDAAVAYWRFSRARPNMFALIFRHDLLDGAGENLREHTGQWLDALATKAGGRREAVRVWSMVHGICALAATNATEIARVDVDEAFVVELVNSAEIGHCR